MDNGEVITGLSDEWTLGGAKLTEWIAGFTVFILASEMFFTSVARMMPVLLGIWLTTTYGLATLRRAFPDEERGIRNAALTAVGIEPPGIPAPAILQPYWSGAPVQSLSATSEFVRLGLEEAMQPEVDMVQLGKGGAHKV